MDGYLEIFLKAVIIFCVCISIICFIRAVIGPTIPDRILAINMIGTDGYGSNIISIFSGSLDIYFLVMEIKLETEAQPISPAR